MTGTHKLMKHMWFPRPHNFQHSWRHSIDSTGAKYATIYPIMFYDEGIGSPSGYNANREHALFAEAGEANCFVESRVDSAFVSMTISMTKACLETDKLSNIRFCYMPIMMAFKEDFIAIDEKSSQEVQDVLEMQTESVDRQAYPLYNGSKVIEKYVNSALMPANQPGLTLTQVLEYITFTTGDYYDMLQYMTNGHKLRTVQGGLKWGTLTRNRPNQTIRFRLRGKTKRMNPYTFWGILLLVPRIDTVDQIHIGADATIDMQHVDVMMTTRYNEWNQEFDFKKV